MTDSNLTTTDILLDVMKEIEDRAASLRSALISKDKDHLEIDSILENNQVHQEEINELELFIENHIVLPSGHQFDERLRIEVMLGRQSWHLNGIALHPAYKHEILAQIAILHRWLVLQKNLPCKSEGQVERGGSP